MLTRRRGFSLTELLIVIGIVAVLIAILVPVIGKSREAAKRAKCALQLRGILAAMTAYAQEDGEFPRTNYNDASGGVSVASKYAKAFSGSASDDPFTGTAATSTTGSNSGRPQDNDVTAALFLLVRLNRVTPQNFICPSSDDEADTLNSEPAALRGNFSSRRNLSYSVAMPYPLVHDNSGTKIQYGYYYGSDMKGDLPVLADLNPGSSGTPKVYELTLASPEKDMRAGNSRNHARAGQNVAYMDGRVEWANTPFAGRDRDNIYTRTTSNPPPSDRASDTVHPFGTMPPRHVGDSVLFPTETAPAAGPADISAF
jgi:prepilin-type N-terminal cleavage/methylation domain-containing protein